MGTSQDKAWVQRAEALIGHVSILLADRKSIERALRKQHGREVAAAMLDQLEHLTAALSVEVYRTGPARSRRRAGLIAKAVLGGALFLSQAVAEEMVGDLYDALKGAEREAAILVQLCDGDGDEALGRSSSEPGSAGAGSGVLISEDGRTLIMEDGSEYDIPVGFSVLFDDEDVVFDGDEPVIVEDD